MPRKTPTPNDEYRAHIAAVFAEAERLCGASLEGYVFTADNVSADGARHWEFERSEPYHDLDIWFPPNACPVPFEPLDY